MLEVGVRVPVNALSLTLDVFDIHLNTVEMRRAMKGV